MAQNNRVYFAVEQLGIAPDGSNVFTAVHGLQSVGVSTKFNLEQVFEIGQVSIYQMIENIPDIEVTAEKVMDQNPLLYHLGTYPSVSPSLSGRSNTKCIVGMSVYSDQQNSASGTPISQTTMSGVFVSSLAYSLNVDGNATESVSFVGNNKVWNNAFTAATFNNADAPVSGVFRRADVVMGSGVGCSLWPQDIPGINVGGYNMVIAGTNSQLAHIQTFRTSANLGRTPLFELGHKGPYFRYVQFPVQVNTEIDVIATDGDHVTALQEVNNTVNRVIKVFLSNGSYFDLGVNNRLVSCTFGGANASAQGGNATWTYSYLNFNDLIVHDPSDPSGL